MNRFTSLLLLACAIQAAAEPPQANPLTATSPTGIVNAHLPRWIQFSGEVRYREEGFLGDRFTADRDDMYLLQRVRLGVRIQPFSWMGFFVQGQDARAYLTDRVPSAPPLQDAADVRQAYIQLGAADHGALDLRVGRQDLAFGEERLVGASNWGNIARSFDAVRLGLHHGESRVDFFASSVVAPRDGTFDHHVAGDNLHGIYGHLGGVIPQAEVEPFVFWRLAPSVASESGLRGGLDTKTYGIRVAGTLPASFEYAMELAGQAGSWSRDDVRAWAGFWRIGRELPQLPYNPRIRLEVNRATGDSSPADGRHGTFDVLYPTAHDKYGMTDQVGWKNVVHLGLIGELRPRRSLVVQVKGHDWWLESPTDGLYNSGGALLVRDASGNSGRHIGQEIDFQAIWSPEKHVSLGGGIGHLFPGEFLKNTTPGHGYTFPYVQLTWTL